MFVANYFFEEELRNTCFIYIILLNLYHTTTNKVKQKFITILVDF